MQRSVPSVQGEESIALAALMGPPEGLAVRGWGSYLQAGPWRSFGVTPRHTRGLGGLGAGHTAIRGLVSDSSIRPARGGFNQNNKQPGTVGCARGVRVRCGSAQGSTALRLLGEERFSPAEGAGPASGAQQRCLCAGRGAAGLGHARSRRHSETVQEQG